jgi:transposase
MEISEEQHRKIQPFLLTQRGLVYRCENGCKWRALPETFGHWHVIYMRLNRWAKSGVLERVFSTLRTEGLLGMQTLPLDLTAIKALQTRRGAPQKTGSKR